MTRSALWLLFLGCLFTGISEADDHAHEGEEGGGGEVAASVGPGKAVTAASPKTGLQLSEKGVRTLGLRTAAIGKAPFRVPVSALVYFQSEVGVYRLKEGWFKLVEITVVQKNASEATVSSEELAPGDTLVVSGVGGLRVAELEAFGGSGEGHGH